MEDDWEQLADSDIVKPAPKAVEKVNKWEGEDEEEEVKESWEDEEEKKDEEKTEIKIVKTKPKTSLAEKIAGKERLHQEELERKRLEKEESITPEQRLAEKLRLQKLQEEADLKTALDTLGIANTRCGIDAIEPTNKAEFAELTEAISKKVAQYKAHEEFPTFLEELVRDLCVQVSSFDLKKIKNTIDNLFIEKQKFEKDKAKGNKAKTKSKAKLRMEGDNASIADYGCTDYDYDDFM